MSDISGELTSTLGGVSGNFLFNQEEALEDIGISFGLVGRGREDIPLHFGYEARAWEDLFLVFLIQRAGSYNFNDFATHFEITNGATYEDMGLRFSVIRTPQTLTIYLFEKLYCTTTEITTNQDMYLANWNVDPNQIWYVLARGDGYTGDMVIELYQTLSDLTNRTNLYASGTVDADDLTVILTDTSLNTLEYYYQDYSFHLTVSMYLTGSTSRSWKLKPLTDISEINHAIYNNSNISISRGQAELDIHTYAVLGREITLGTHLPELECGDIVELNSTRRNKIEKSMVLSQNISGSQDDSGNSQLITTINVATYLELSRQ